MYSHVSNGAQLSLLFRPRREAAKYTAMWCVPARGRTAENEWREAHCRGAFADRPPTLSQTARVQPRKPRVVFSAMGWGVGYMQHVGVHEGRVTNMSSWDGFVASFTTKHTNASAQVLTMNRKPHARLCSPPNPGRRPEKRLQLCWVAIVETLPSTRHRLAPNAPLREQILAQWAHPLRSPPTHTHTHGQAVKNQRPANVKL